MTGLVKKRGLGRGPHFISVPGGNGRKGTDNSRAGYFIGVGQGAVFVYFARKASHIPDRGNAAQDAIPEIELDLRIHLVDAAKINLVHKGHGDVHMVVDQARKHGPAFEIHLLEIAILGQVVPRPDILNPIPLHQDDPVRLKLAGNAVKQPKIM